MSVRPPYFPSSLTAARILALALALTNPTVVTTASASDAPASVAGDASAGNLQLSANQYTVAASAGSVTITAVRSGGANVAASVNYTTRSNTAVAGTNFVNSSGTLNWAANDSSPKTFTVPILAAAASGNAIFDVSLSSPGDGATLGAVSSASVTITPDGASGMGIAVSGNTLVDQSGNVVQLRGVNISGLEFVAVAGWSPANPWGGQAGAATPNWAAIKAWGANAVRLPLNAASWLGLSCLDVGGYAGHAGATISADPGGNYQATVEKSVADANAAGLYVILDLHFSAPNQNGKPLCPNVENAMADSDNAVPFWTSIANQFKANPAVIFELFNEPFLSSGNAALVGDAPWQTLLSGGSVSKFAYSGGAGSMSLTWSIAGMQQLLDAVRGTGANNVVLTSTLGYSSSMDGWLKYMPNDPAGQLGAVWHAYPASDEGYPTQVLCEGDGIVTVGLPGCSSQEMSAVQAILAAGYPVVATEFGDSIGGASAPWASILLPFADTAGVSYLAWTWDTWNFSKDVLITDGSGTPTQGFGTYVQQHFLCRAAGTAQCQ
jgi:hypothetical protein